MNRISDALTKHRAMTFLRDFLKFSRQNCCHRLNGFFGLTGGQSGESWRVWRQ
jgi:hypothetical protein